LWKPLTGRVSVLMTPDPTTGAATAAAGSAQRTRKKEMRVMRLSSNGIRSNWMRSRGIAADSL
jgi:hypothetical protein